MISRKFFSSLFILLVFTFAANGQGLRINEVCSANSKILTDAAGETPDWIEFINTGDSTINLAEYLIADKSEFSKAWQLPQVAINPGEFFLILASGNDRQGSDSTEVHTDFRISADGETLYLFTKDKQLYESLDVPALADDESYGIPADEPGHYIIFQNPTPGVQNANAADANRLADPLFSLQAGHYAGSISLALSHTQPNVQIFFTDNGKPPHMGSTLYEQPVEITKTTVIRAIAYKGEEMHSNVVTQTYLIDDMSDLPIVSLSTHPGNFFDWEEGIYVMGPNAEPEVPYYGANFWQDWEKPVHIEFFETDKSQAFSIDAGVKIFGNWSRSTPMKSLSIFARKEYGTGSIKHKIFADKEIDHFESFLLRNAGNDWKHAYFRDGLVHELAKHMNIDREAFRPAVVYLNGEYWGIHNLREKQSEHYLASNHGVDPDRLDLLKFHVDVIEGSNRDFLDLENYIKYHDLKNDNYFQYVAEHMDIDNYTDYMLLEIWSANWDWPWNNTKKWRAWDGGKWRWLLFDIDAGLSDRYDNTLLRVLGDENLDHWSSTPMKDLIKNRKYREKLLNRLADLLNSLLYRDFALSEVNRLREILVNEMPRHQKRWSGSASDWENKIQTIEGFIKGRPQIVRTHFENYFDLSGHFQLTIDSTDLRNGSIQVNTVEIPSVPWYGIYFNNIPFQITATPNPGYKFAGWNNADFPDSSTIEVYKKSDVLLTPEFEKLDLGIPEIQFSEIHFISNSSFDTGDWVEIHNPGDTVVHLASWWFKDSEESRAFIFPDSVQIEANGFLVLAEDLNKFHSVFPDLKNTTGNLGFGFKSTGELLRLYHKSGVLVDSLTFALGGDWPAFAGNEGFTLELKSGATDNNLAENWQLSGWAQGTPGERSTQLEGLVPRIIISEINFQSADSLDVGDWVEFYNAEDTTVFLGEWRFQDEKAENYYIFPEDTKIKSGDYIVLCQTSSAFSHYFPWSASVLGDFTFGLKSTGELLRLRTGNGLYADSLRYTNMAPWPQLSDNSGLTIERKDLTLPAHDPQNWQVANIMGGTPGLRNSVIEFAKPQIIINELQLRTAENNPADQWFELYNATDSLVEISGWSLRHGGFQNRYFFPDSTVLQAGKFLVFTAHEEAFLSVYPEVENVIELPGLVVNWRSDSLKLINAFSGEIDRIAWNAEANWLFSDSSLQTLELIADTLDNALTENWQFSFTEGGTPGRENSHLPTGIDEEAFAFIPERFALYQNFPNPFNPSTTIRFDLPELSEVSIVIYNIIGQHVQTLVEEKLPAGRHQVVWRPLHLRDNASGVYIARLSARGKTRHFMSTKKMLYIK
ncbi:MAG: lamin tail domain-containing protein [Deferribacteres bacterium]|nr:lamin tail domain-containing protein [candidate division KSB1 bacterium]MCB9503594.1 lamin tail domain-containing protein [Deferribacteres bacterium]